MNNQNLAIKIKDLRNRKGFSQEQLAEESKLSLRTIQRIEKAESIPRGDTLVKLTQALGVTPDDLLDWTKIEDKGYLALLNLSAISYIIQPFLGIIIPLVMWILKRDKINLVDDTGKKLISFQITWLLIFFGFFMIINRGIYIPYNFSIVEWFALLTTSINSIITSSIIILYLYNLVLIFINIRRNQKGLKSRYFPAIPFLK